MFLFVLSSVSAFAEVELYLIQNLMAMAPAQKLYVYKIYVFASFTVKADKVDI